MLLDKCIPQRRCQSHGFTCSVAVPYPWVLCKYGAYIKGKSTNTPRTGKKISPCPNLNPKLNGGSHSPLIEGSFFPWRDNCIQCAQVISAPRVPLGHPHSSSAFPSPVPFRAQLCPWGSAGMVFGLWSCCGVGGKGSIG